MNCENKSAKVPERGKQAEEDVWQSYGAERGVWTEPMLIALERGVRGNKWFSLIDKVRATRTLELAWIKVKSNAGACGVEGITVERFGKDSQSGLLALKEHLTEGTYQLSFHPEKTRWVDMTGPESHFDFLGYRFKRTQRGRMIKLVRPKSLRKLRETIKPKTLRTCDRNLEALAAELNRTLKGWYVYFKHVHPRQLGEIDGWVRGRLRSILRKRAGRKGRARGDDHHRWPNRYFTELGLFSLLDARNSERISLRNGANL